MKYFLAFLSEIELMVMSSNRCLDQQEVLRFGVQIAEALTVAHSEGVVHRDLKPSNIMLAREGVKLLDFGLAKLRAVEAAATGEEATMSLALTAQGTFLGTLSYMAPEQLEGNTADARSDLFAFGAVLYEMATGRRAFDGDSAANVIARILDSEPPPVAQGDSSVSPLLDHVISGCLAKDPEERWQSAADIRRELHWIAQGDGAPTASAGSRRRWLVTTVGWTTVGLIVGAALTALMIRSNPAAQRTATVAARFKIPADVGWEVVNAPLVTPDGRRVIYAGLGPDGKRQLFA